LLSFTTLKSLAPIQRPPCVNMQQDHDRADGQPLILDAIEHHLVLQQLHLGCPRAIAFKMAFGAALQERDDAANERARPVSAISTRITGMKKYVM